MTPSDMANGLTLTWLDDSARIPALAAEWQALADRLGAEVFMCPDWQQIWWAHFGAGRRLACLVARHDGALVGVLPFCLERLWLGPVPIRAARLAGTDPNCITFQLALDPAWAAPVLLAAIRHLTGALRCRAVSFTPVSAMATHADTLRTLAGAGTGLVLQEEDAGNHVIFELPDPAQPYTERISKGRRDQYKRNVKGLTKAFQMDSDMIAPDAAQFDAFVTMHNDQWQATGRGGHFTDWPGSTDFYRDLAVQTAATQRVQLDRLTGSTGTLSQEFSLVAGPRAHWKLPARSFDAEANRQSAGTVVFVRMFERMLKDGLKLVEGGRGEYGYKLEYGGQPVPVFRMILRPDTALAGLRLKALLGWANLLHFLYYRIWFLKLAPVVQKRTGRKPRPLWRSWIRTRL